MTELKEHLTHLMDNDRYFTEAWDWYASKYLKMMVERMLLIVLSILCCVILAIHIFATDTFFPLSQPIPFVMYADESSDDLQIIKKLTSSDVNDPQIALAKYLVAYYVKLREEYNYETIDQQKFYVKANSSRLIYNNFIDYLDVNTNPNSPLLKYKKEGKKTVEISNTGLYGTGNSNAKVQFITHDNVTNTRKEQNVMLRFTISNLVPTILKLVPLEFRVIAYGK